MARGQSKDPVLTSLVCTHLYISVCIHIRNKYRKKSGGGMKGEGVVLELK